MCKKLTAIVLCGVIVPLLSSVGFSQTEVQSQIRRLQTQDGNAISGASTNLPGLTSSNINSTYSNSLNQLGFFSNSQKTDRVINDAAKALRQASSQTEKDAAEKKLNSLLSDDYDARLKTYEDYLSDLEKQLATMRKKLEKRKEAKSAMIDLRIKVLQAESDDLGWPTRMRSNRKPLFPGSNISPIGQPSSPFGVSKSK